MRTVFLALGLFIASTLPALAASPYNTYTHHTAFAVPEQSFQLAATWFLPDWQAGISARTDTAPAGSGDRHDLTCSVYGGCLGIPANMTCSDDFTVDGKTCYKSCSCKSGFVPASSSDICKGCVNPCDARTAVDAPYGCEKYFSDCASKCEKAYPDNCRLYNGVDEGAFGCKEYYDDCPEKCKEAYPDNCHSHTAVSAPYGCEKYFDDCKSKCEKAYPDNCRNYSSKPAASSCANGCAQGKTYADCSSKCSVGCKAKCDTGYHLSSDELSCVADSCPGGYEAGKTCGAGYKRLQSGQSGATPCYKCEVIPCTAGSTSCLQNQTAVANGYYSGEDPCYECKDCVSPDASQGWGISVTCSDLGLEEVYLAKQSQTDKCNVTYSRCCKMPYGCGFDFNGWNADYPSCNYGYYVTEVDASQTGLSFVPAKITYVPEPSVSITPTGTTGTGSGSCYASNSSYVEESFSSCGITYSRKCLDLNEDLGWTEVSGYYPDNGESCGNSGYEIGKLIVQDDGCERTFTCCKTEDCAVYENEFRTLYNNFVSQYVNKCPASYIRNNCESDEGDLVALATLLEQNCYMSGTDYRSMMNEYNIGASYVCNFWGC